MKFLSRKDKKIFLFYIIFVGIISIFFQKDKISLDRGDLISFLSIIIGFLLTALSILYASPLRVILYKEVDKDYITLWQKILSYYKFCTYYSSYYYFFILTLNLFILFPN